MSKHRFRQFFIATICGLVPLIPVAPVNAATYPNAKSTQAPPATTESAVLRKFRDSGVPVMERAAQFEATAAPGALHPTTIKKARPLTAVNNTRLYPEVFGFAFARSLGDPPVG